jgi:hypothetical protein
MGLNRTFWTYKDYFGLLKSTSQVSLAVSTIGMNDCDVQTGLLMSTLMEHRDSARVSPGLSPPTCYSDGLALACSYMQMKHHTTQQACMRSVELVGLLDAVHDSAVSLWELHLITQTTKEQLSAHLYAQCVDTWVDFQLPLQDGSAAFVELLLDMVANPTIATEARLQCSAIKALSAAWPLMIEHWLTENVILLTATDGVETLDEGAIRNRLLRDSEEPLRLLARLALRALSQEDTCGRLLEKLLECFQKRVAHGVDGEKLQIFRMKSWGVW